MPKRTNNLILNTFEGENLNGTHITSFDYFLYMNDHNIPTDLVIISEDPVKHKKRVMHLIRDRYKEPVYEDSIHFIKKNDIMFWKADKVLLHSGTYEDYGKIIDLIADRIYCLGSHRSFNIPEDIFKNTIYLSEYNVYPNNVMYKKKLYLEKIKDPKNSKNRRFLHLGDKYGGPDSYAKKGVKCDIVEPQYIVDQINKLNTNEQKDTVIYTNPKFSAVTEYIVQRTEGVSYITEHPENFFEQFDEYLYIHLNFKDYSPRMFIESGYLGKGITYVNEFCRTDGCDERYQDTLDQNYGKYLFSEQDFIIKEFK